MFAWHDGEISFVAEVPRNSLGKIQKQALVTEVAR